MCEKPIVTAPEQFDELCAFAAEKGLVYMEAIMMRYLPAREILHKAMGQIGRISAARFDFSQLSSRYPALLKGEVPNIFNPAMAAGSLMDLGVYCVYPAIDLFGEPERVRASAGFLSTGADGFGSACLSYPERRCCSRGQKSGRAMQAPKSWAIRAASPSSPFQCWQDGAAPAGWDAANTLRIA